MPTGRREGRRRDRRGRGMRGPGLLPGPHSPRGVPAARSRKAAFDALVLTLVQELDSRWHAELGLVEFAVEETPLVPDDWDADTVPLASLVRGTGGEPDPAGAVPPADRAALRHPRRPVRDGAHGARRAGLRAPRPPARGGRPPLRRRRRLSRSAQPGPDRGSLLAQRQRGQRHGRQPAAGVDDRPAHRAAARRGVTTT